MNRRTFLGALCALGLVPPLSGCAPKPITLGVVPAAGALPLQLARLEGLLPAVVQWQVFPDQATLIRAMRDGTLSVAMLALDDFMVLRAESIPLSVAALLDESAGADVLLVDPSRTDAAGLAGARVGLDGSASALGLLAHVMSRAGLSADAVVQQMMPANELPVARAEGSIDAALASGPLVAKLEAAGMVRLADSTAVPRMFFNVLAVRRDEHGGYGEDVHRVIDAHFALRERVLNADDATLGRLAAALGSDVATLRALLATHRLPDRDENRLLMQRDGHLLKVAEHLSTLMVGVGRLRRVDPLRGLMDGQYVRADPVS